MTHIKKVIFLSLFTCFAIPTIIASDKQENNRDWLNYIKTGSLYAIIPSLVMTKTEMKQNIKKLTPKKQMLRYASCGAKNYAVLTGVFSVFYGIAHEYRELLKNK